MLVQGQTTSAGASQAGTAVSGGESAAGNEEDIDLGGGGMFDEDVAGAMGLPQQPQANKSIADMVAPWGGYGGGSSKKKPLKLKSATALSISMQNHLLYSKLTSVTLAMFTC